MPGHSRLRPGWLLAFAGASIVIFSAAAYAREEIAKLTPSDPGAVLGFGQAVAISTEYIVVGAPSGAGSITPGAIVVFKREGSEWVQEYKFFSNASGAYADAFGSAVAIDGDVIGVGAPYWGAVGPGVGYVSVFRREGSTWIWETDLASSGSEYADSFGCSVSMDAGRIVVGAKDEGPTTGAAYVFRRQDKTWIEEARLVPGDLADGDTFGWSVSMDGDLVVVGSTRDDDAGASSGSAYVFRREKGGWAEEAKLTASDAAEGDVFGVSVSLHGESVVVGAANKDDAGTNSGAAYIFRRDQGDWVEEAKLMPPDAATYYFFGYAVAVDGDLIVVGVPGDDHAGAYAGAGYFFKRYDTKWVQLDRLMASDAIPHASLGVAVSVAGDLAVVGHGAYVYALSGDIPAVSAWGLIALTFLLLVTGTIALRSRRRAEDRHAMSARCA